MGGQARHGNVRADGIPAAGAKQVRVGGLVGRRVPWRDRPLRERETPVGDRLVQIHADDAAEALAGRTRAERRVECEHRRRRIAELAPAAGTVQPAAEHARALRALHPDLERPCQGKGGLRRRGDLGARGFADDEAPHDERQPPLGVEQGRRRLRRSRRSPPPERAPGRTPRGGIPRSARRRWPRACASARLPAPRTARARAPAPRASRAPPARPRRAPRPRDPPRPAPPPRRSRGRMSSRRGRRAAGASRGSRSACRRWSARCAPRSSARGRWREAPARSSRRPDDPASRGTGGRRSRATPRIASALRRKGCRRRGSTCPSPRRR